MWTQKHIEELAAKGKIRGFKTSTFQKGTNSNKSAALAWLDKNLSYWSKENGLKMEKEYRFDGVRRYRFDYAWPEIMTALEFEGGVFMKRSGHNTAAGLTRDSDKYNLATVQGWRVIRFTALNYSKAIRILNELIKTTNL